MLNIQTPIRLAAQRTARQVLIENCEPRFLLSVAFGAANGIGVDGDLNFPTTAITADFDGDGDLDVAGMGYDQVAWYANNGKGAFGSRRTISTDVGYAAPGPGSLAAGDINGDKRADLVVVNYEYPADTEELKSRVVWYSYQSRSTSWTSHTISVDRIGGLQPAALADLDKDGDLDVIVSNYRFEESIRVAWFENRSAGSAWKTHVVTSDGAIGEGSRALALGDLNRDGWIDIVAGARFSGTVTAYLNPRQPQSRPDGAWSPVVIDATMNEMTGVTVGDLNGDGTLDVAAVTDNPYDDLGEGSTGRVVWYPGQLSNPGRFGAPVVLEPPGDYQRPWSIQAIDLDHDGSLDLLVGAVSHVDWFRNLGGGSFDAPRNIGVIADAWSRAADLNGDGRLDVLSAVAPANRMVWYPASEGGSISGRVFNDIDRDGSWDTRERGLAGQQVYIDRNNNGVLDPYEPVSLTDRSGRYQIDGLAAGKHILRANLPVTWYEAHPGIGQGISFTLKQGERVTQMPQGVYFAPATIAGLIFNDLDRDGKQDPGEPGIEDRTVFIDLDGDGYMRIDEPSTSTNSQGRFVFAGLGRGTYLLQEEMRAGWSQSQPADGQQIRVTILPSQTRSGLRFGMYYNPASISGHVFNDLSRDGIWEASEPPQSGWRVYLDLDRDGIYDPEEPSTITDAVGRFKLGGLIPDEYILNLVLPPGWYQSSPEYDSSRFYPETGQQIKGVLFGVWKGPTIPSGVLVGPLLPGSGRYTKIVNGGFESGLANWSTVGNDLGWFSPSSRSPLRGTGSALAYTANEFEGAGFAISQRISVTPGEFYVLSGMIRAEAGAGGSAYLDLGDPYFEPGGGASGVLAEMSQTKTQFVYAGFLVPRGVTEVDVRVVRDGFAGLTIPGKLVWFDEIAVTPLAQFRAPRRA